MVSRNAIFASLPLLAAASMASAANMQLEKLFAQNPDNPATHICMVRHYDKAHLRSHPNQNVTDMLVYIGKHEGVQDGYVSYDVNVQVKFRDSKKLQTFSGGCGREIGQSTTISCGIDCDGGGYNVTLKDDKSVELKLPYSVRLDGEEDENYKPETVGFKSDDHAFVLHQTTLETCLPVIYDEGLKAGMARGAVTQ